MAEGYHDYPTLRKMARTNFVLHFDLNKTRLSLKLDRTEKIKITDQKAKAKDKLSIRPDFMKSLVPKQTF